MSSSTVRLRSNCTVLVINKKMKNSFLIIIIPTLQIARLYRRLNYALCWVWEPITGLQTATMLSEWWTNAVKKGSDEKGASVATAKRKKVNVIFPLS